ISPQLTLVFDRGDLAAGIPAMTRPMGCAGRLLGEYNVRGMAHAFTFARASRGSLSYVRAMAKRTQAPAGLEGIAGAARKAGGKGLPPVHLWNPPYCGDIDMRIAGDGTWFYQKTPIGRAALVKLFASVLKREGDKYFLVTPVEKCGIAVDDAPFLAVE